MIDGFIAGLMTCPLPDAELRWLVFADWLEERGEEGPFRLAGQIREITSAPLLPSMARYKLPWIDSGKMLSFRCLQHSCRRLAPWQRHGDLNFAAARCPECGKVAFGVFGKRLGDMPLHIYGDGDIQAAIRHLLCLNLFKKEVAEFLLRCVREQSERGEVTRGEDGQARA